MTDIRWAEFKRLFDRREDAPPGLTCQQCAHWRGETLSCGWWGRRVVCWFSDPACAKFVAIGILCDCGGCPQCLDAQGGREADDGEEEEDTMGYTTKFTGEFKLDPQLSHEQWLELMDLHEKMATRGGAPDSYCQWVPDRRGVALRWDGEEKFYNYAEWLEWLIREKFTPWGVTVAGCVQWQGEEVGDVGQLEVASGVVTATKLTLAGKEATLGELSGLAGLSLARRLMELFKVTYR